MNNTSPPNITALRTVILEMAIEQNKQYPQYEGHWSGPDWKVAQGKKTIKGKMGVSLEKGEYTIARKLPPKDADLMFRGEALVREYVEFYSTRTGCNTIIRATALSFLEE